MTAPELETPRPPGGPGFSDAVTVSFGDPAPSSTGCVRVGLSPGSPIRASALALLFSGREVAAADVRGGVELAQPGYAPEELSGLGIETVERLARWRARFEGEEGGFELDVRALGPPLSLEGGDPAGELAASDGYEQLCMVEGRCAPGASSTASPARASAGTRGARRTGSGSSSTRALSIWLGEEGGLTLAAARPARRRGSRRGGGLRAGWPSPPTTGSRRGSSTSRGCRRPTTATAASGARGWSCGSSEDDDYPRRAVGRGRCAGSTLELGALRLDCAFFAWPFDGRPAVGRYDILRRT